MSKFASVVVSRAHPNIDKVYQYSIPDPLVQKIEVGSQVLVPFGSGKDIGYVVGFSETAEVAKLKDVIRVTSEVPLFNEASVKLAKWMSQYYLSFFILALRAVMPPGMQKDEKREMGLPGQGDEKHKRKNAKKAKAEEKTPHKIGHPLEPTEEQKKALDEIVASLNEGKPRTILLYGVTGSGKTEVYLQAAEHALKRGKSSIILVPEVALTGHLIDRVNERFGSELVILHSEMPLKARRENWIKASSGRPKIILGTRLAIFAPVKDPKLIVLDEEFETAYKQEQNPRYHTRDVAAFISQETGATLLLSSATPSIETFYKAKQGEYRLLTLSKRINDRPLPKVSVVDMNSEAKGRGTLSSKLREKIKETLADGKQVVLFINRRGFFTGMMCRECRHIVKCPKCSVPLTLHFEVQKLKCGHCGFSSSSKIVCPNCQSSSIFYFGAGTQRIESEVKEIFPQARIARIDRDTGAKRGSHEALFSSFKEGKANVLIGTQMVTKGLDVENVTLVGVVDADTALNSPDFRAAERTFELIEQVAGRAGRHAHAGEVVIQTFNPDHYAIKCAANHDYETFFNEEIRSRSELCYPPFSRLVNLIISGAKELNVKDAAQKIKGLIEKKLKGGEEVLGPAIAPVEKKRGDFRWQVLLKGKDISSIRKTVVESLAEVVSLSGIRTSVDVDPISML